MSKNVDFFNFHKIYWFNGIISMFSNNRRNNKKEQFLVALFLVS